LENKRYEFKLIKLVRNAGELQIVPNSCPYSLIQVSADKAYVPTFNLGNIMVVDTKTMTKIGEIDLTKYAHADNSPEPACGIVRDGIFYLALGKIAAYVGISELMTDNPYTARNSMAVIIDLKKKSIKKIEGIPYTDGHSVAIESKGNDVLFASCGVDASGVFDYNVETGKVSQVLSTSANVAFMHFFD
jgi:hypothetical protein